jgi:nucleoside-diphosphate-sugar epimerase
LTGKPITIYGDGKQTRSFCYVDDLVTGIYSFWKHKPQGPLNLGNSIEMNMLEAAKIIIEKTESTSQITFKPLPENDPKQRCPDISKVKKLLNWEPKVSLSDGLENTITYFRSVEKGLEYFTGSKHHS